MIGMVPHSSAVVIALRLQPEIQSKRQKGEFHRCMLHDHSRCEQAAQQIFEEKLENMKP